MKIVLIPMKGEVEIEAWWDNIMQQVGVIVPFADEYEIERQEPQE